MRKFAAVSIALLVSLSSAACEEGMDDDGMDDDGMVSADQYLQASSTITQCPGTAPEMVRMDITDAASGVAMAASQITVEESGAYLIVAAPQVGREGAGPYGCFDLWLRVNGDRCGQLQRPALPGRGEHGQGCHHLAGNRPARGG